MPRLNPGDSFPKLTLSTTDGQLTTVPDAFARDFGVVLFYPGAWCPYCSPQPGPSTSRPSSSDTAPSRRPSPPIPAPLSTLIRSTRSPPASDRLIGMVRHGDSTPQILGLISQPSTASCRKTINHVGRGVEDDRVGQQGGELDLVLQLGGVVVADAALVAEPAPGGEVVVGLDLVRRRGGSPAQLRIRQIPKQLDGSGDPPGLAERQVEVCCAGSASTAGSSVTGEIFPGGDRQHDPHQVVEVALDEIPVGDVAAGLAEQSVDVAEGIWPLGGSGRRAHLVSSAGAVAAALAARTASLSAVMS